MLWAVSSEVFKEEVACAHACMHTCAHAHACTVRKKLPFGQVICCMSDMWVHAWKVIISLKDLTTMRIQKYAKSCCHKTTWAIIIVWWPQSTYWKPQVRLCLHYSKEAGLLYTSGASFSKSSYIGAVNITLCKTRGLCSLELNFGLFCDILGEWT